MAITLRLQIAQIDGSDFVKTDETADVELRSESDSYASTYVTGTHIANGVYSFPGVISGIYRVYDTSAGTQLTSFGDIQVGEGGAVHTTGNETIGGTKTFSAQSVFSSGFKTNTIAENTSGSGVTIDGLLIKDSTIGNVEFTGTAQNSNAPTVGDDLCNKTYVDAQVASVNVQEYQQGTGRRRVIAGATEDSGKVYTTIAGAITSVGTTSTTARYIIELEQGQADSNYANVFQLLHANCSKDYISFVGKSRNGTHLILGGTGDTASLTRIVSFENMTIYLTTEISGTRTYGSVKFINCTIYGYRSTYFANSELHNCDVVHASSYTPYLSSGGKCFNTVFAQAVTEDSYTGDAYYHDSYNTSPSMPTAPNLGS